MKIKVILPNSSPELAEDRAKERKAIVADNTEIDVVSLPHGPVSVDNAVDEARAIPYILDEIKVAEEEGYDAVTIDCASDPSPRAIKETASIPIVIGGEAARVMAMLLGDKFSVITTESSAIPSVQHSVEAAGLGSKLASVRAIDMPVLDLLDHEKSKGAILKEVKKAVERDGAHVIILGCAGMSPILAYLQENLQVPVIDPGGAALKIAEILVSLKLTHSKLCFPTPPPKKMN